MYKKNRKSQLGFTLVEILVVVLIIGISLGIAIPSWNGFINSQRLNDAQTTVFQAMRQAQNNAKRDKQPYMAAFRNIDINQSGERTEYVVVPVPNVPGQTLRQNSLTLSQSSSLNWLPLTPDMRLVRRTEPDTAKTTLSPNDDDNGPFRVVFGKDGGLPDPVNIGNGKAVIRSSSLGLDSQRRCVIISTLIGSLRTASNDRCN